MSQRQTDILAGCHMPSVCEQGLIVWQCSRIVVVRTSMLLSSSTRWGSGHWALQLLVNSVTGKADDT